MKLTYRVLAMLIAVGVVLQAATIAYAWFDVIKDLDGGAVIDENFEGNAGHALHGILGLMVIPALAIVLLIISFFAKVRGGVKWAALVLLTAVLQIVLAFVSFGVAAVGALHGINALVMLAVAGTAARRASERDVEAASPVVTAAPSVERPVETSG